jgi:hypothetical protein
MSALVNRIDGDVWGDLAGSKDLELTEVKVK